MTTGCGVTDTYDELVNPDTSAADELIDAQDRVAAAPDQVFEQCLEQSSTYSSSGCLVALEDGIAANRHLSALVQEDRYQHLEREHVKNCTTALDAEVGAYEQWQASLSGRDNALDDAAIDTLRLYGQADWCGSFLLIGSDDLDLAWWFRLLREIVTDPLILSLAAVTVAWSFLQYLIDRRVKNERAIATADPAHDRAPASRPIDAMSSQGPPAVARRTLPEIVDPWLVSFVDWKKSLRPTHRLILATMTLVPAVVFAWAAEKVLDSLF